MAQLPLESHHRDICDTTTHRRGGSLSGPDEQRVEMLGINEVAAWTWGGNSLGYEELGSSTVVHR